MTGSSFLTVMDRLAFEVIPGTGNQTSGNIGIVHQISHSLQLARKL